MINHAADAHRVMHHFQAIILVEDVLSGAAVDNNVESAAVGVRHDISVQIEYDGLVTAEYVVSDILDSGAGEYVPQPSAVDPAEFGAMVRAGCDHFRIGGQVGGVPDIVEVAHKADDFLRLAEANVLSPDIQDFAGPERRSGRREDLENLRNARPHTPLPHHHRDSCLQDPHYLS